MPVRKDDPGYQPLPNQDPTMNQSMGVPQQPYGAPQYQQPMPPAMPPQQPPMQPPMPGQPQIEGQVPQMVPVAAWVPPPQPMQQMMAPPQQFQYYNYQPIPQYGYQQMGLNPQDFAFCQQPNPQQVQFMQSMDINVYSQNAPQGIPIQPPRYGDPVKQFEEVQANSIFRQETEHEPKNETDKGNIYEGQRDEQGRREGQGKFTFADGSVYQGEWHQGLRQGVGMFQTVATEKMAQTTYKGQWINDLKHGHGKMWDENGDVIVGTWQHDKKNGLFRIYKKGTEDFEEVVFKDDMLVQISSNGLSGAETAYMIMSAFFMLGVYSSVPVAILINEESMYGVTGGCAFIYLIWSWCTAATKYICNTTKIMRVFENVEAAIRAPPKCRHHMECYHYETIVHHERDSDGNHRTRTERRKVVTHTAWQDFRFDLCIDRSPPASTLSYLDVLHLVRLRTYKKINYTPAAWSRYLWEKADFKARHSRDVHNDYSYHQDIPYQMEHVLVYNDAKGGAPCYVNVCLLFLLDFIMLGWIQRLMMLKGTGRVEYQLDKLIVR